MRCFHPRFGCRKKETRGQRQPWGEGKGETKEKKGKTPETADTESVFEKLQNEQDAHNDEVEHEIAA